MKADREAGADRMSTDEIPSQLRTLVQAGFEPVGCVIPVRSHPCGMK